MRQVITTWVIYSLVCGLGIGPREGVLLGYAIVTDGDFTAYVCNSAATWPYSQITFGYSCRVINFLIALLTALMFNA